MDQYPTSTQAHTTMHTEQRRTPHEETQLFRNGLSAPCDFRQRDSTVLSELMFGFYRLCKLVGDTIRDPRGLSTGNDYEGRINRARLE
jgi:hypothetical protein